MIILLTDQEVRVTTFPNVTHISVGIKKKKKKISKVVLEMGNVKYAPLIFLKKNFFLIFFTPPPSPTL